ncbi:MAG TPA: cellulose synthase family protein [Vicinamibacteria bacterium]|jgi:cellulose synthase/poly-beta-1,6-N-acetylglucosamine synthase-like glycosyltransferase
MSPLEAATLGLYFLTLVILAVFGVHRYVVVYLYYRHRDKRAVPVPLPEALPRVTVQLPLYNEMYVVERLLQSVAAIRYPKELLEIQVLDDSTDETQQIARRATDRYREQGFDIHYLHRADRTGFKAGALDAGLQAATGEFILIFDADFVAPPDILEKTLGHFQDARVGMVQARWDHINRDYSLLTQVQSMLLDGHFVLEHGGRNRSGRFFNFNGTAGVWRRSVIADAGGWQHDTLTEDLDLSYRAQMKGWRFVFLQDVVSPAELPVEMNAFKSQQFRWAKGQIQTCRKLLPAIFASDLPLSVKSEAFFHLGANFGYPLMILLSLLMFPAMVIRYNMGWYEMLIVDVPLFMGATMSVCSFYLTSQREIFGKDWKSRLRYLPAVLSIGIGLAVNNAKAVWEAMRGVPSDFMRTPKYGVEGQGDDWRLKRYRGELNLVPFFELVLGLYFTFMAVYAASNGIFGTLPFILLFQFGFLYVACLSLFQDLGRLEVVQQQEA